MLVILFFRRIYSFPSSLSVSIRDLTAIVVAYFAILTGSMEREAERIMDLVRRTFFHVNNLQSIGFLDFSGKLTLISDLTNHAADIILFSFRSAAMASVINQRFPSTTFHLIFR